MHNKWYGVTKHKARGDQAVPEGARRPVIFKMVVQVVILRKSSLSKGTGICHVAL